MTPLPRHASLRRPLLLHLQPLLTLRLPLPQPHLLKIHVRGIKRRVVAAVEGTFALEELGEVAGLDLFGFEGVHFAEGAGESGLGGVGEAVEVVGEFFANIVAGVVDGGAAAVFVGEFDGGEVFEGGFVFIVGFLFLGIDVFAGVGGRGFFLLFGAWGAFVPVVVVVWMVRLGPLFAFGALCTLRSSYGR